MSKVLLYATNNPGKVEEISKLLNFYGIKVVCPKDLEIDLDVPETGSSLEENATLKVKGFRKVSDCKLILADDTGLEIDALGGEPGIHVRRWKDGKTRMTDQEIIDYCLEKMKNVPKEKRGAQFRTVLSLGQSDGTIEIFDGILRGVILEKPAEIRVEGFPFESLFFVTEWNMILGEQHHLKAEEKGKRLNHRERALQKAIPRIKELLEK
jgi:XTP/dITP diphosphohydrolase